jgi:hypothetical protein
MGTDNAHFIICKLINIKSEEKENVLNQRGGSPHSENMGGEEVELISKRQKQLTLHMR